MIKKLTLFVLAAVLASTAFAQNANRSGFFLEVGIGGSVGKSPYVGLEFRDGMLSRFRATGPAFNLAFGQRFRTSNHFSMDIRGVIQAPFSYVTSAPVAKLMPTVRYTSSELFSNVSLYAQLGIGAAVGNHNCGIGWHLPEPDEKVLFNIFGLENEGIRETTMGIAYNIAVGLNLTTHMYAGLVWDGQAMIFNTTSHRYNNYHHENNNWGLMGVQIGYRF